jgi:hypothetical protein
MWSVPEFIRVVMSWRSHIHGSRPNWRETKKSES